MRESDQSILLKLLALGRAVEKRAEAPALQGTIPSNILSQILALASLLETSEEKPLQKIAELADSLHPDMPLEKFAHFMVPIERALDRSAKDFDFLITNADKLVERDFARVPLVGVLDHIRSGFNVGSIFRVADGFGLSHLHLVGYTATPEEPGVMKTSLGAETAVPWTRWSSIDACFEGLRGEGYKIVALETSPSAANILDFKFDEKTALVLGNERFGLNYAVVGKCDATLTIPLRGTKNSLNVVSAFAIAGYEWTRQWGPR